MAVSKNVSFEIPQNKSNITIYSNVLFKSQGKMREKFEFEITFLKFNFH